MITMTGLRWVVFDEDGARALPDDEALVRWAQAQGLATVVAWAADPTTKAMLPCSVVRTGLSWSFAFPQSWTFGPFVGREWSVAADPSDDPRVLSIVDWIERHAAEAGVATPVRWHPLEWPPGDLHADADPHLIGTKLGSLFDIGVSHDHAGAVGYFWHYCPERIALVAADVTDDELTSVLNYLEGRISLTLVHEREDPAERERLIDQTYLEPNPRLRGMLTGLLLRAIDVDL